MGVSVPENVILIHNLNITGWEIEDPAGERWRLTGADTPHVEELVMVLKEPWSGPLCGQWPLRWSQHSDIIKGTPPFGKFTLHPCLHMCVSDWCLVYRGRLEAVQGSSTVCFSAEPWRIFSQEVSAIFKKRKAKLKSHFGCKEECRRVNVGWKSWRNKFAQWLVVKK